MPSANRTTMPKLQILSLLLLLAPMLTFSQENSPYSRYGIGNLTSQGNIFNRGMGGISAGFADAVTINNTNPASYGNIIYTTLDVGVEYDNRVVKSQNPLGTFKSNNGVISYLQVAFPLLTGNRKAEAKRNGWGLTLGLKPLSKINYKISSLTRNSLDSVATLYEGSGGVNEVFLGMGLKLKNFNIGFNSGYLFGNKDYNTKLLFYDSLYHYKADYDNHTTFGGVFFTGGMQYSFVLKKGDTTKGILRLGAYGTVGGDYRGNKDFAVQTFDYNPSSGAVDKIDSVYETLDQVGTVHLPATYGAGFTLEKSHIILGADLETTNWDTYSFFGQKDQLKNSWMGRVGLQYFPSPEGSPKYLNNVRYRAGFSLGSDYISPGVDLPLYNISVGATFPLKVRRSFYDYQYSYLNFSLEYGGRGNNSINIKENTFKIGVGFTLSDRSWFARRKFN